MIDHGCGSDFDTLNALTYAPPAWTKARPETLLSDGKDVGAAKAATAPRAAASAPAKPQAGAIAPANLMSSAREDQLSTAILAAGAGCLSAAQRSGRTADCGSSFRRECDQPYRTLYFRHPVAYTVKVHARDNAAASAGE